MNKSTWNTALNCGNYKYKDLEIIETIYNHLKCLVDIKSTEHLL